MYTLYVNVLVHKVSNISKSKIQNLFNVLLIFLKLFITLVKFSETFI